MLLVHICPLYTYHRLLCHLNMYCNNLYTFGAFALTIWIWDGHRSPMLCFSFSLSRLSLHFSFTSIDSDCKQALDHYANVWCQQIKFTLNPNNIKCYSIFLCDAYKSIATVTRTQWQQLSAIKNANPETLCQPQISVCASAIEEKKLFVFLYFSLARYRILMTLLENCFRIILKSHTKRRGKNLLEPFVIVVLMLCIINSSQIYLLANVSSDRFLLAFIIYIFLGHIA